MGRTHGSPAADYTSVRHQAAERRAFEPVVGSAWPQELLADPALATLPSDAGSPFARPYDKVKRSPQNDDFVTGSMKATGRRSARTLRVHRLHDVGLMDAMVNRRNEEAFNSLMWQSDRYDSVEA